MQLYTYKQCGKCNHGDLDCCCWNTKVEMYKSAWGGKVRLPGAIDDKTESEGEAGNLEEDRDFRHERNREREPQSV